MSGQDSNIIQETYALGCGNLYMDSVIAVIFSPLTKLQSSGAHKNPITLGRSKNMSNRHEQRIDLIQLALKHKNGKKQRINTLWVGSMATAKLCGILGIKYGDEDLIKTLNDLREPRDSCAVYSKIHNAFEFMSKYIMDMGIFEDYYSSKRLF